MPGNNPNQNARQPENHGRGPIKGFPGMSTETKGGQGRSSQEVADARIANTEKFVGEDGENTLESEDDGPSTREPVRKKPRSREA